MFRCAKPFGQGFALDPNTGVPPAAYGGSTAGGCTPRPPGGRSPPRYGLNGQQRHPTPNATRAPCFVMAFPAAVAPLQGSTRGAMAQPHTPPPARPVKQVFGGRRPLRAPAGATTMPQASPGGPRAACRRGGMQGRRPRRPTAGWAEVGGCFAKLRTALCFAARNRLAKASPWTPIPASRPPPMAAPRQGVAPPGPREGEALPATA